MTSQPAPAAPEPSPTPGGEPAISVRRTGSAPADLPPEPERARAPSEEAIHALERVRDLLTMAETELAEGSDERAAAAYDHTAACADHIARALWYLRRVQTQRHTPTPA